jgi:hypothetical protein
VAYRVAQVTWRCPASITFHWFLPNLPRDYMRSVIIVPILQTIKPRLRNCVTQTRVEEPWLKFVAVWFLCLFFFFLTTRLSHLF